jgi:L-malate glycosyltransferase
VTARTLAIGMVCYPGFGGSGIVATELALGLARRGHQLHLIASSAPSRPLPECDRLSLHRVDTPNYPVFEAGHGGAASAIGAPYTLALATAIARVSEEQKLDLLHVHYAVPHAASAFLARQLLGPAAPRCVVTLHGTDVTHVGREPAYRAITRFSVEAADAISVPSLFLQSEARRSIGISAARPIELIENFVDTERFDPPTQRDPRRCDALFDAGPSAPTLFHVSNFRPVKRVTDLLEVLARVRERMAARLVLVGDGPDRAAAERRARALGLARSVAFLGKRPDFVDYLRHADAFLLTSESESFGLAALEALSCGVPVLGYRVGGVPALVSDDVGRLVEPFDSAALAEASCALLADPQLRDAMGAAARARVLARYRTGPALERYESLFERVLAEPRGERG